MSVYDALVRDPAAPTATVGSGSGVASGSGLDPTVIVVGAVAIGALIYLVVREQGRYDRLTPEQQHEYRMDQIKANVAGALTSRLLGH